MKDTHATAPFPLPLVGRRADVDALRLALDDAIDGQGCLLLLDGESGIGKSRLVALLMEEARGRGALPLSGRGFALEQGRPWGPWSDAIAPWVRAAGPGMSAVARGLEGDLAAIVPAIATSARRDVEDKGRLYWNFAQFLQRLAARQPLVIALEDLHVVDPGTIELLHFVGRQLEAVPLLLVGTWVTGGEHPGAPGAPGTPPLLTAVDGARRRTLAPLTVADLRELLHRAFGVSPGDAATFAAALHARTGGNPFFVEELLKAMVATGDLRRGPAGWQGFEHGVASGLPTTIREAIRSRLTALTPEAHKVIEVVALAGVGASIAVLEHASGLAAGDLASVLDDVCARQLLVPPASPDGPYTFVHDLVAAAVEEGISVARARAIHRAIAQSLMTSPASTGGVVARHLTRAGLATSVEALPHLIAAGRDALARRADEEAFRWLRDARALAGASASGASDAEVMRLSADLARAAQRLGMFAEADTHRDEALAMARQRGELVATAAILRDSANALVARGRPEAALEMLVHAREAAASAGAFPMVVAVEVATATILQSLGRSGEAMGVLEAVLPAVEQSRDDRLRATVHRALTLLHGWCGPAATARRHAEAALRAARAAADDDVAWSVHWALAVLEGFSGHGDGVRRHRDEAARLAESLGSPLRQAITAEVAIEYASAVGEWDEALTWAARAIPIARAVAPGTLLPRLLVWTGLVHLARDERERAVAMLDEAWDRSGAGQTGDVPPASVQNVILAHTGRVALLLADGAWEPARALGEAGLALSDRYGFVAWGIHRLLPQVAEAAMWQQDYDRALEVRERLLRDGALLDHKLALAWAAAIDGLVARLRDGRPDAADRLLAAADELEAVPFVFHAARLRRNAAQILETDGRIDEAVRQLRLAHEVFLRTGAEFELRGTRSHLRSLGVRLPPRNVSEGAGSLTGRELDIARAVAKHLTNKEIGDLLDISARTVSTHLSNIFQKLGVESRAELADRVRDDPRLAGG